MRSKTISLIVFLVICVKTLNGISYSFCQSFAENDFKISYTFNRLTEKDAYLSYIFIGQKYWRFKYIDDRDDWKKRVELLAEDGKLSNWFGSQYSSAFCTWFDNKCLVGLFSANFTEKTSEDQKYTTRTLTYGRLEENRDELNLKEIVIIKRGIRFNGEMKNIVTAFVPNWGHFTHNLVIVYEHKPDIHWDYIKVRDDYDLERGVSGALDGLSEKEIANIDPVSLSQEHMIPGLDVIGVVAQYSTADYERNGGRWGHGLIVLFQWDRSIRYCYTFTRGLSDVCKKRPQVLIDCSHIERSTTVIEMPKEEEESSYMTQIVIVIITELLFIIAIVLVFLIKRKRHDDVKSKENPSKAKKSS